MSKKIVYLDILEPSNLAISLTNIIILLIILTLLPILCFIASITHAAENLSDSKGFNIAAVGDWACNDNSKNTVENIKTNKAELVLALGDLSYQRSPDCWFEIISPLDNLTRLVRGDHDNDARMVQYMEHFKMDKEFYSFNDMNIHFLIMSTETPYDMKSEQYQFVKSDLENVSNDSNIQWTIVAYHQLAYTSPTDCKGCSPRVTLRETYHQLFDKYGVDVVLQAHDHNYERSYPILFNEQHSDQPIVANNSENNYNFTTDPHGIVFATVGTGGGELNFFNGKAPYIAKQFRGFGFLNIDLVKNGNGLIFTFIANNGTPYDRFTINK